MSGSVADLLRVSGIAIVGGTPRNQMAGWVLAGLKSVGFQGGVACINPAAEPVGSVAGYASLEDVPFLLDAAVLVVRAQRVPAIVRKCGHLGIRSVTILSGGFAETGAAGGSLQAEIVAIADEFGIAVCGPNCLGFASLHDRTSSYARPDLPHVAGPVGVLSHSGGMLNEVMSYGTYRGIRFSALVSPGNEAVCTAADVVDYLVDDDRTSTIGLILEGVRGPERLRAAFERAATAHKPIVTMKIGSSPLAAAATVTHTGAIAGSADLFSALARQYGLTVVEDIEELCEALLLFSRARRLFTKTEVGGLVAIEVSGGGKSLICDLAARRGLDLSPLDAAVASRIGPILGDLSSPSNPIDLASSWDAPTSLDQHVRILDELGAGGLNDVVVSRVTVLPNWQLDSALAHGRIVAAANERHPDVLFAMLGRTSAAIPPEWQDFCAETGATYLQGYRRGIGALAALDAYRRFSRREPAKAPRTIEFPVIVGCGVLDEVASKTVLRQAGLPANETLFVASADEAMAAASELGYPVVIKGISPHATHKSDLGLVAIGLKSAGEVAAAAARILPVVSSLGDTAARTGLSVQRMVDPGLEVIVGAYRDELYGPVVLCALGGVFAEVLDEKLLFLAPVSVVEASRQIDGSKIGRLSRGFRHLPPSDTAKLAQLTADVSRWVASDTRIVEFDANPVILRGAATDIVDARIVARPREASLP